MRYHHFMVDDSDKPATKADLATIKTELREDITRLDKKIDRVAVEVVKTNEQMGQLGKDLRQDMRQLNSDVTAKLDVFIGKMETIWKESAVLPSVVDEHGRRLDVLESRVGVIRDK